MQELTKNPSLDPFVKDILFFESGESNIETKLPFYADGFPGIIYSASANPFFLQPRNKKLPDFYLYGQTIKPISLDVKGEFKLVVLRLYPFAVRILLEVDPKVLNDDCYDLMKIENVDTKGTLEKLRKTEETKGIINILSNYINELLTNASVNPDYRIKLATNLILKSSGNIGVKEVRDRLCVAERTLERHFLKEIGVTPKQFAKIIQFSSSMNQISEDEYVNLTEIGYHNGFADQSHFIKSFKRYSGKTPKEFQKQLSV
jgi:AraC-like DNA-binding protein